MWTQVSGSTVTNKTRKCQERFEPNSDYDNENILNHIVNPAKQKK